MTRLALALFVMRTPILRLIGDYVRDHYGAVWSIRTSCFFAAVGILIAALAVTPLQAIFGFALAGIGIANIKPIAFFAAGKLPEILASTGMRIVTTIGDLGP